MKTGKWSVISQKKRPVTFVDSILFVKILSLYDVILLGLVIAGYKLILNILLIKSSAVL